ncbi:MULTISPECIES: metal-sensitive transcriptional regulator [Dermacoccus]|uniref:Metal-sensitive transcriptional regulator n=3 Tax=Dermacoccus TaxID=57495 RepID=A0A417Z993_9MICO|nr:metal-sensitive transcriptional regulator [Dermacoccus abyssi]RHW47202.1 metal-sensitive transcriptional regulator [Dermacoccus abyssi]
MTTPTTATDAQRAACPSDEGAAVHGYISDKTKYRHRLRRLEGQVRGIDRMVDQERYCIDILTQISAITRALEGVALSLLDDHLKHCLLDAAVAGGPVSEQQLEEASQAISRLVRS